MPEFFIKMLENQYGKDIALKIIDGFSKVKKTTFRVNTLKSSREKVIDVLKNKNIKFKNVDWSKDAFILEDIKEDEIRKLDIYQNGEIYLQNLSSMLPPIVLEPKENQDILDMAAAPGGKTTQIAAITNNKAHITACEINNIRIERLKYNIEKQGASCIYIMKKDAKQIDDFFSFDKILLDAPCSGSGTLNINNKNLQKNFTEKLIQKSMNSQYELLKKAIKILKKGQEMVYSTCSILSVENEEIIFKIMKDFKNLNLEIVPINFLGIEDLPKLPTKISGTLLLCPDELYEGFFIAKIRKGK